MALYVYERWDVRRTTSQRPVYKYQMLQGEKLTEFKSNEHVISVDENKVVLNEDNGTYNIVNLGKKNIYIGTIDSAENWSETSYGNFIRMSYNGRHDHIWVVSFKMYTDRYISHYENITTVNKGNTFLGTVIAEDGTYPNNSYVGNYWYVKKSIATAPKLLQPNGGEQILREYTIKWENSLPNQQTRIELSANNGSTWQVIDTAAKGITEYEYDFYKAPVTSNALIRVAHFDGQYTGAYDTSKGVFQIEHNKPPTMPTNLQPNGIPTDNQLDTLMSWTFVDPDVNDYQTRYDLRWRLQGSEEWNEITRNTTATAYILPSGTMPLGTVEWQVRTYDRRSEISPWSRLAVFTSAEGIMPPVITTPDTVGVARPTITWTSEEQSAYELEILNMWSSGVVVSTAKATTVPVDLLNGGRYTVRLRVRGNNGVWSDWTSKELLVVYTPPAVPSVTVVAKETSIVLYISNPTPTGTQPDVVKNVIEKMINGQWVSVAEVDSNGYFEDYHVAYNKEYVYRVITHGDNDTISTSELYTSQLVYSKTGTLFFDVNNPSVNHPFEVIFNTRSKNINRESVQRIYYGRSRPVYESSPMTFETLSFVINLKGDERGRSLIEDWIMNNTLLGYKDDRGRLLYTVLNNIDINDIYLGYNVEVTITAYDYKEGL